MKTLSELIQRLSTSRHGHELFRLYQGEDWKNSVSYQYGDRNCFHKTLWEERHMKLVITGWREKQYYRYYTGYGAIYTRVLDGLLESSIQLPDKHRYQRLLPKSYLYVPAFSVLNIVSTRPSVTLHLLCESYVN